MTSGTTRIRDRQRRPATPRRAALALAVLSTLTACLAPPVMLPTGPTDLDAALALHPPGARRIEVAHEGGPTLRGVFVPAGENAPVVLHLLGAAQSPASRSLSLDAITWDLADRGFASLMLDYSGVGASSGSASTDALDPDAWLMWRTAVELANGRPERVVIRATSLGAIACALTLERGARPSAILLVAPVFPDTVVQRYALDVHGVLAQAFAALAFRPVARVNVLEQLRDCGAPLSARVFRGDTWVTAAQTRALKQVVAAAPSHAWVEQDGNHVGGVLFATTLSPQERDWLSQLTQLAPGPVRSVEAARAELSAPAREALAPETLADERFAGLAQRFALVPADLLAAAALEHDDLDLAAQLIEAVRHSVDAGVEFSRLRGRFSTAGDSPQALVSAVGSLHFFGGSLVQRGLARDESGWGDPARIARNLKRTTRANPKLARRLSGHDVRGVASASMTLTGLVALTRSDYELRRVLARAALKLADVPERVISERAGAATLEYFDGRSWRVLDLGAPREAAEVAP